ncbi:MAG: D-alanine--D-alanine ligase family protein [Bacteroidota bacterium]
MSPSKTSLALIFGGQSPEHEVSIRSARNIFDAIPTEKYEIVLIGVDKEGVWKHIGEGELRKENLNLKTAGKALAVVPGAKENQIVYLSTTEGSFPQVNVVFPITHGPYGEDGTLQGILMHLGLPFVGPGVLGSSAAMDKDVCKRLLRDADLKVAEYVCFQYYEKDAIDYIGVVNKLGLPLFIKPANMGSSVGVKKVESKTEFDAAIQEAFRYDHKVIVEEAIVGRELECAVMGNAVVETSHVGEVAVDPEAAGLYDYESKYVSATAAKTLIPAPDIDDQTLAKLLLVAKNSYRVVGCEGMTRVDMFLTEEGHVYVNELNTLPGFTSISMYPKLWEHAGTSYSDLIDHLIELALERGERDKKLEKSLS